MAFIYHITTPEKWLSAQGTGAYEADSLHTEGFIHCSTGEQLHGVLERYYKGKTGLLKLVIDTGKVLPRLVYELSPSIKQAFPHIYGPLNIDAVIDTIQI